MADIIDRRRAVTSFCRAEQRSQGVEWCLGQEGNIEIGVGLAAAPLAIGILAMSLLPECHRWSERAILALDDTGRGGQREMHLQAALGMSSMFTRGNSEEARAALHRVFTIAEERNDAPYQLQLLNMLHLFHGRAADFNGALQYAERSAAVAKRIAVPTAMALAHSLVGSSLHRTGDLAGARRELEKALQDRPSARQTGTVYLDFEHYNYAEIALARTLWLQGYPNQALERVHEGVANAASIGHPVPLSRALVWGLAVFIWAGDLESADEHASRLISLAELHDLGLIWPSAKDIGAHWLFVGAMQTKEFGACSALWRSSIRCTTSCVRQNLTPPSPRDSQLLESSVKA